MKLSDILIFGMQKALLSSVTFSQENPTRANGHIFNVGNPNNEVTVRQLGEMMTEVIILLVR